MNWKLVRLIAGSPLLLAGAIFTLLGVFLLEVAFTFKYWDRQKGAAQVRAMTLQAAIGRKL